jgi:hypothetical protein
MSTYAAKIGLWVYVWRKNIEEAMIRRGVKSERRNYDISISSAFPVYILFLYLPVLFEHSGQILFQCSHHRRGFGQGSFDIEGETRVFNGA